MFKPSCTNGGNAKLWLSRLLGYAGNAGMGCAQGEFDLLSVWCLDVVVRYHITKFGALQIRKRSDLVVEHSHSLISGDDSHCYFSFRLNDGCVMRISKLVAAAAHLNMHALNVRSNISVCGPNESHPYL